MPQFFSRFYGEIGHAEVNSRLNFGAVVLDHMVKSLTESHIEKRGHEYGVQHFLVVTGGALNHVIERELGLDSEQLRFLHEMGAIYLNEERHSGDIDCQVIAGDYLRVHTKPRRFAFDQQNLEFLLVYQNDDFVVVNKPAGIPAHATVDNQKENLLVLVEKHLGVEAFVTNRLDIATSGLLVLAKTKSFQALFNQYLKQRQVKKHYRALVERNEGLRPSRLVHFMEPSPRAPKLLSPLKKEGWQKCILNIVGVQQIGDVTEVIIELETGRTHQIRAQFSAIGSPLVGDRMYGSRFVSKEKRQEIALQSCGLEFPEKFKFCLDDTGWAVEQLKKYDKA